MSLVHPHSDSVSCTALNSRYIHADVSGRRQRELLAVGSYDGCIALYDLDDVRGRAGGSGADEGATIVQDPALLLEGPTDVEYLSFHPRGGTVLLAGSVADGTVWMYHVPPSWTTTGGGGVGRCMQVFVGHEGGSTCGGFTPDGRWVITAGVDGTCRIWAPRTGASRHVFRLVDGGRRGHDVEDDENLMMGGGLTCLALGGGQDGQLAACGGEDGCAHVVHVSGRKVLARLVHNDGSSNVVPPPTATTTITMATRTTTWTTTITTVVADRER